MGGGLPRTTFGINEAEGQKYESSVCGPIPIRAELIPNLPSCPSCPVAIPSVVRAEMNVLLLFLLSG